MSTPSTWKALSTLEWKKVRMHNKTLMPAGRDSTWKRWLAASRSAQQQMHHVGLEQQLLVDCAFLHAEAEAACSSCQQGRWGDPGRGGRRGGGQGRPRPQQ